MPIVYHFFKLNDTVPPSLLRLPVIDDPFGMINEITVALLNFFFLLLPILTVDLPSSIIMFVIPL